MKEQNELFPPLKPYPATVRLGDIETWTTDGAASKTGRSIAALGFITAPLLRKIAPDRYRVVDGARRLTDLRSQHGEGWAEVEITAMVVESDSDAEIAAARVALNTQRGPNPLQEARAYRDMVTEGLTEGAIARVTGVSKATIRKRLRMLEVPTPVLEALEWGEIKPSTAERIANMSLLDQAEVVRRLHGGEKVTHATLSEIREGARTAALETLDLGLGTPKTPGWARASAASVALRDAIEFAQTEGMGLDELISLIKSLWR